jgi:hypothetical protein
VKHGRAHQGHRRDQTHERDGHDLHGDARLDAVEQVLAGVLAVAEVAGCRDGEDRHRSGDQVAAVRAEELHQLHHARYPVLGERAGDDGLARVRQAQVEAPGIGDLRLDVVVGRERRSEMGDVVEGVGQPRVLDEVRRVGEPCIARAVVEHLEATGAGHEVHAVAADLRVRFTLAIVEREGARTARDGRVHLLRWKQHAFARRVRGQPVVEQALAQLRAADLHADLAHDALRFREDAHDELVAQNVERRPHRLTPSGAPGQAAPPSSWRFANWRQTVAPRGRGGGFRDEDCEDAWARFEAEGRALDERFSWSASAALGRFAPLGSRLVTEWIGY